ncbi:SIR2 family protein [Thalassovita taeanensis]|uniref:SIR2 family protein n=1 Tax=Thalassovita taeanensis TaxID=657014 RepID=UPI000B7FA787|nr:SIR2 family protein [Thalassovita taeanensis]
MFNLSVVGLGLVVRRQFILADEKTANDVSVIEVLQRFEQDFATFSKAVENGEFAFWIGSGISRNAPNLGDLLIKAAEFLREKAVVEDGNGKFSNTLRELLEIAEFGPELLDSNLQVQFSDWPDQEAIISRLWNQYSEVLDLRVPDEDSDYILWDAIGIREAFENPAPPAIEHLCIAALILEGVVRNIASANWDTFIEQAVEKLSPGASNIIQVVVDPIQLRTPPGRARLLKFHGCIRHATDEPGTFRKYLTGSTTQISDWPQTPLFAAVRNELVGIATNQKALGMGLSMQDQNLHQTISRAKEVNPWPWPSEPNAPGYVFCEDRLKAGQRAALRLVYRDSYDANAADIIAGAHLRAWPEQVLIGLLLQLTFHKLDYLLNDWVANIGKDDFNAELSASLKSCRDFIANSATDNRQTFFDQAHLTWPRLLSLYRKGTVPKSAGTYEAISATSLSQLPGDQLARDSHLGQLALALCLINYGRTQGLWTLLPALNDEIEGGSLTVTGTWPGAEPRPLFIVKSVTEAIILEKDGAFEGQGAIVVHADNLWPRLRPDGGSTRSARSPRSSPGRNASVRTTHLSLEAMLEKSDNLQNLNTEFVTQASV